MILKGSQRGNGSDLAVHLMNGFDNEKIEVAEVYGTIAGDLLGAFAEFEAVSSGTKAENYLYSLSINPPSPLDRDQYFECIQAIETSLGLTDQPRAVVFHEKHGREHCHVVWSRIDVDQMKAIQLSHDHSKLMDLACELAHKYGLELPPGLKAWQADQKFEKDKLEPNLAERAQENETGLTAEERRQIITECYERSDTAKAFVGAMEQSGFVLAHGDRRGLVIVDEQTNVHSLTRYVKGHSAKDIRAKLASLDVSQLPSVEEAKDRVRSRVLERQEGEDERQAKLDRAIAEARQKLSQRHEQTRAQLRQREQELLTRQQSERLALHAAQKSDEKGVLFRARTAVADLLKKTPGLRSVLSHIQKVTGLDPRERHELERKAFTQRHQRERKEFERQKRFRSRIETRENRSLEARVIREVAQKLEIAGKAQRDFAAAAKDRIAQPTDMEEGDLQVAFNDAAEFEEGVGQSVDGEREMTWADRAQQLKEEQGIKPINKRGFDKGND